MSDLLATEKQYLNENLERLRKLHPGKYVLIHDEEVLGAFETYDAGVDYGVNNVREKPFLVRSVMKPEDQAADVPALSLGIPLSCRS